MHVFLLKKKKKCQKYKSQGFDDRNLKNKENLKYFEYKMQIFDMDILGYLSVVLDCPTAKGKQSLPLCNVVHPWVTDWVLHFSSQF